DAPRESRPTTATRCHVTASRRAVTSVVDEEAAGAASGCMYSPQLDVVAPSFGGDRSRRAYGTGGWGSDEWWSGRGILRPAKTSENGGGEVTDEQKRAFDFVVGLRDFYGQYHDRKEQIAYTVVILHLGAAAILMSHPFWMKWRATWTGLAIWVAVTS